MEYAIGFYDPANLGVSTEVLSNPTFWFVIILSYLITFGSRFAERTGQWVFRPHDAMILAEKERAVEAAGSNLMAEASGKTRARLIALGSLNSSPPSDENSSATSRGRVANGSDIVKPKPAGRVDEPTRERIPEDDSVREWDKLQPGEISV